MSRKFDPSSGSRFLLNNLIRAVADRDFDDAMVEAETILDAVNAFVLGARPGSHRPTGVFVSGNVTTLCVTSTNICRILR